MPQHKRAVCKLCLTHTNQYWGVAAPVCGPRTGADTPTTRVGVHRRSHPATNPNIQLRNITWSCALAEQCEHAPGGLTGSQTAPPVRYHPHQNHALSAKQSLKLTETTNGAVCVKLTRSTVLVAPALGCQRSSQVCALPCICACALHTHRRTQLLCVSTKESRSGPGPQTVRLCAVWKVHPLVHP